MTTNLLPTPTPNPVWPRSKIQCLLGGEEGEGGEGEEVGAGAASSWEKRRKRKKLRKVTQPLHKKQTCNFV